MQGTVLSYVGSLVHVIQPRKAGDIGFDGYDTIIYNRILNYVWNAAVDYKKPYDAFISVSITRNN